MHIPEQQARPLAATAKPLFLCCCPAGVTTGPVTVPFVLSIGIGFSKAVGAPEGFGMLTVMSVAPIISVLLVSLLKQPVKQATQTLVRVSKIPLQRISRPLRSSGGGDRCVLRPQQCKCCWGLDTEQAHAL
jgi:hypothetical protein